MKQSIQQWLSMLSPREQIMVLGGLGAALLILLWGLVLDPLQTHHAKLEKQIQERENELRWMRMAQSRIKQAEALSSGQTSAVFSGNPSQLIERTLQRYDLKKGLQQMRGDNQIRISLKEVEADNVMSFLGELETSNGLTIASMEITPINDKGIVNANLQIGK